MPDRWIREGIIKSDAVNVLSFPAEVFFRRLLNVIDDFARFDGRAAILRAELYPLKLGTVSEADVQRWLAECQKARLVSLYTVNSKDFIRVENFGQRKRAKKSKYPEPPIQEGELSESPTSDNKSPPPQTCADMCEHVSTNVRPKSSIVNRQSINDPPINPPTRGDGSNDLPKMAESFEKARAAYPGTKRGLEPEWENFAKRYKRPSEIVPLLLPAIEAQIAMRKKIREAAPKAFLPEWKHFKTWINQKGWTEEIKQDIPVKGRLPTPSHKTTYETMKRRVAEPEGYKHEEITHAKSFIAKYEQYYGI
jgi:hypothetical protein